MNYVTAQFGRPVAKPKPPAQKRQPLTEAELADRWMELAIKEGRIAGPKEKAEPKKVSRKMVERIYHFLSETPTSSADISVRSGVAKGSASCALMILKEDGRANYITQKCLTGSSTRRMWSLA